MNMLIALAAFAGLIVLFVCGLVSKQLWPKILFLIVSLAMLSVAAFFGYNIYQEESSHVDAQIISYQMVDESQYTIECRYIYKNKSYHAYIESYYYNVEPQIGSTIRLYVSRSDPSKAFEPAFCGTSMALLYIGLYIFLIGGLVIFIPTLIALIICLINRKKRRQYGIY